MAHQDELLAFMFDALNGVYHAYIFAHLECGLSNLHLHVLQALLTESLKEYLRIPQAGLCYLYASIVSVDCEVLQKES